jgi:hypothetical protein
MGGLIRFMIEQADESSIPYREKLAGMCIGLQGWRPCGTSPKVECTHSKKKLADASVILQRKLAVMCPPVSSPVVSPRTCSIHSWDML